ncbi:hypothetical protein BC831DRAFT_554112, partial [Entophlyctis helioformis]
MPHNEATIQSHGVLVAVQVGAGRPPASAAASGPCASASGPPHGDSPSKHGDPAPAADQGAPASGSVHAATWTITHVSTSVQPVLGHRPEQILGCNFLSRLVPSRSVAAWLDIASFLGSRPVPLPHLAAPHCCILPVRLASGVAVPSHVALHNVRPDPPDSADPDGPAVLLIIEMDLVNNCNASSRRPLDAALSVPMIPVLSPLPLHLASPLPPSNADGPSAQAAASSSASASAPSSASLSEQDASESVMPESCKPPSHVVRSLTSCATRSRPQPDTADTSLWHAPVMIPSAWTGVTSDPSKSAVLLHQVLQLVRSAPDVQSKLTTVGRFLLRFTGHEHLIVYKSKTSRSFALVFEEGSPASTSLLNPFNVQAASFASVPDDVWDHYVVRSISSRLIYDNEAAQSHVMRLPGMPMIPLNHCALRANAPFQTSYYASIGAVGYAVSNVLETAILLEQMKSQQLVTDQAILSILSTQGTPAGSHSREPNHEASRQPPATLSDRSLALSSSSDDEWDHSEAISHHIMTNICQLMQFFKADAALINVNKLIRIVSPDELRVRVGLHPGTTVRAATDNHHCAGRLLGMFLDSGHFKHACGLLYIPLTATGDVFVGFLRKESHVSSNLQVAQSREPTSPLDCNATVSVAAASGCDLWTAIDENMAQLVQVIYWWFVSTFQERASAIKNDKLRSLMLANITHELRNPLNAIINFLELMLDDKAGDQGRDQAKQYARHAHEASRALLDIVNDLLFLTQMEAGQMVLREETFVLSEFVRSSVELFDVMAQRRGLELALDIDATLDGMVVVGDAGKIRQVISNL